MQTINPVCPPPKDPPCANCFAKDAELRALREENARLKEARNRETQALRDWAAQIGKPMPDSHAIDCITVISTALRAQLREAEALADDLAEMAGDYLEDAFAMGDHCNECGHDFALEASHCPKCGKAVETEYENSVMDRYRAYRLAHPKEE